MPTPFLLFTPSGAYQRHYRPRGATPWPEALAHWMRPAFPVDRIFLCRLATRSRRDFQRQSHFHGPSDQWPSPIFSTERQTLHKSTFQAHASHLPPVFLSSLLASRENAKATSGAVHAALEPLFGAITQSHPQTKRATHCMYAWCATAATAPAPSPTTRRSPPTGNSKKAKGSTVEEASSRPTLLLGSSSGGESGSGARLEQLLQMRGCTNVVVVVYRWYGGVPLGNARWRCITGAAKEALQAGGWS